MAAELCRVSLWLEALEPGKPLSFLDHHIRVGNSLLGATPDLIAAGLPDDAFTAIEGDDKKALAVLKKLNKAERTRKSGDLFTLDNPEVQARLQQAAATLQELPDDRPEDIRAKELAFRRHEQSEEYRLKKQVADAWCAAFVIRKHFREPGRESSASGITQGHLNDLAAGRPLPADLVAEAEHLSGSTSSSTGIWPSRKCSPKADSIACSGIHRGRKSNCRSGSSLQALIRQLRMQRRRQRLIGQHRSADSREWRLYIQQLEVDAKLSRFYRRCGRFPLTASGEANTYSLFAELAVQLSSSRGAAGQILKTGIVNAVENVHFFQEMVRACRLWVVRDFKNWLGWFPDVGYHERFSLVTIAGAGRTVTCTYAFNCLDVEEAKAYDKVYELSRDQVELLNPNVPVCPVFSTRRDKELTCSVYRRFPPFVREATKTNPWGVQYQRMFDMTADSGAFRQFEELLASGCRMDCDRVFRNEQATFVPLLEGKHIHGYTHRFATYEGVREAERFGIKAATATPTYEQLLDPNYEPMPRYWVDRSGGNSTVRAPLRTTDGALRSVT